MVDYINLYDRALVSMGDRERLLKVVEKAERGEEVVIGFIGGSITMGSGASRYENGYAYRVWKWWVERFGENCRYVNAGIGATTSQFACARVHSDLLCHKPDFVIVEFSVNDEDNDLFMESYESLVRTILDSEKKPAVVVVNNLFYDDGHNAQRIHNTVASYYSLPAISIRDFIYPKIQDGEINASDLTGDMLHPSDSGHALVATIICSCLEDMSMTPLYAVKDEERGSLTKLRFQNSMRLQNKNCTPKAVGFVADERIQNNITEVFSNGWEGRGVGSKLEFELGDCAVVSLQYRKTVKKPACIAKAVLDGDEDNAVILDGNFEETWGDLICLTDILISDENKPHTLTVEIIDSKDNYELPFYLVSVITSKI